MSNNEDNRWPSPDEEPPTRPIAEGRTAEYAWTPPHGGGYSGSAYTAPTSSYESVGGTATPPPVPPAPPNPSYGYSQFEGPSATPKSRTGLGVLRWIAVVLVSAIVGGTTAAVVDRGESSAIGNTSPTLAPTAAGLPATPSSIRSVLNTVQPAVVSIQVRTRQGNGSGTGMIISPDGEILTNAHVVQGATAIAVTLDGETQSRPADLLGSDITIDSAVIKLRDASGLPTVTLADARGVQVGDQVVAIGNALGLPGGPTVTTGIVSAKDRVTPDATGTGQLENLIQTDAAINPGNSGGPLVNMAGQVVGMNTEVIRGQNGEYESIGFAIPTNTVQPALDDLKANRTIERPYLGVSTVTVDDDLRERYELDTPSGALIASVTPDSPAADAGFNAYDVIVSFDGRDITDATSLVNAVRAKKVGDQVEVVYVRNNDRRTTTVTLEARPTTGSLR